MQLIKKILEWIINFFRRLFGKKNLNIKAPQNIKKSKNDSTIKTGTNVSNDTIPSYMFITDENKRLLINKMIYTKKKIQEKNDIYIDREVASIISMLLNNLPQNSSCKKEKLLELEKNLKTNLPDVSINIFNELINDLSIDKKEILTHKYNDFWNNCRNLQNSISIIDDRINYIDINNITFVEDNVIENMSECLLKDIDISSDYSKKVEKYNERILYVMENINRNIVDEVMREYKKVNYITLATILIDEIESKIQKINDNYRNHRYNKSYYEREINSIKKQIKNIKELKNNPIVNEEILKLRKELYTKSKDKYDILYNNEVFMNIDKQCDDLLDKVNTKVVDIKKEVENNKVNEKNEYLKKVLLRFQDMAKARGIILKSNLLEVDFKNTEKIVEYINKIYDEYILGISDTFNYNRNKNKTELVVLFNGLNKTICKINNEKFISIDHINFRMKDLLDAVVVKKEELENIMSDKYHISINNSVVDDKIDGLIPKDKNNKVLKREKK